MCLKSQLQPLHYSITYKINICFFVVIIATYAVTQRNIATSILHNYMTSFVKMGFMYTHIQCFELSICNHLIFDLATTF